MSAGVPAADIDHFWYHPAPRSSSPNEYAWDEVNRVVIWRTGEYIVDCTPTLRESEGWQLKPISEVPEWYIVGLMQVIEDQVANAEKARLAALEASDAG